MAGYGLIQRLNRPQIRHWQSCSRVGVQGWRGRTGTLISHAGHRTTLAMPPLTAAVGLPASFAGLVTSLSCAACLAPGGIAASGTAIALAAITTYADREHSTALWKAAYFQTKNGFGVAERSPHFGIMPDLMIGRMTLPSTG